MGLLAIYWWNILRFFFFLNKHNSTTNGYKKWGWGWFLFTPDFICMQHQWQSCQVIPPSEISPTYSRFELYLSCYFSDRFSDTSEHLSDWEIHVPCEIQSHVLWTQMWWIIISIIPFLLKVDTLIQRLATCGSWVACSSLAPLQWLPVALSINKQINKNGNE